MASPADPMAFVQVLRDNMLAQDIAFSIQHPDENIRDKAKAKAVESITALKNAGIDTSLIFYQVCTSITMMYVTNQLSLLNHRELITEYLNAIWPDCPEKAEKLNQQMIVEMSVVKAKASPSSQNILNAVQSAFQQNTGVPESI